MNGEKRPESAEPKQTAEERLKQVREDIKNSKYFINRTQPGNGIAIIGGTWHRKDPEEQ
jgi:hypothetical protein